MAIRGDSYSTTSQVLAYTRHLLDGESAFNSTTRPTNTELEKFIDRASGVLNTQIWGNGFNPATVSANSTAVLSLDDWVTNRAARMVELTQRGTGYGDGEGSRLVGLSSLLNDAPEFVANSALGWERAGIAIADPKSQGLAFTAIDKRSQRADPTDTTREQPTFIRHQFDND